MRNPADPNSVQIYRRKGKVKGYIRNGKPSLNISLPVYLYEAIRKEAEEKERSIRSVIVEWLEAAYALSNDGE